MFNDIRHDFRPHLGARAIDWMLHINWTVAEP